jgi:hypothetical protein
MPPAQVIIFREIKIKIIIIISSAKRNSFKACNTSIQETEAGELHVPGQPELHNETPISNPPKCRQKGSSLKVSYNGGLLVMNFLVLT